MQSQRWALAALALISVLALVWGFSRSSAPVVRRMQFALPVPGQVSQTALSADGQWLAFVSPDEKTDVPMLYVQRIGSSNALELAGTEGATYPFWSPDASYVAYFAKNKLLKVVASGGSPQALATTSIARGGTWGTKNVILYTPDPQGGMWRVNPDGSGNAPLNPSLFEKNEQSHRWPVFLPDGNERREHRFGDKAEHTVVASVNFQ